MMHTFFVSQKFSTMYMLSFQRLAASLKVELEVAKRESSTAKEVAFRTKEKHAKVIIGI